MQNQKELNQRESLFTDCNGKVYPRSIHITEKGETVYMVCLEKEDYLIAPPEVGLKGQTIENTKGGAVILAPLSHENAIRLRQLFRFTAPTPVLTHKCTVGVGDRLGIATPGQLRAFERYDALPVLAQQSKRELTLTNRSYQEVLDDVSFAVFREDWQRGFGADGDHLKKTEEVEYALSCGYTMITLDCSEYINNRVSSYTQEEIIKRYRPDASLEAEYVDTTFTIGDFRIYCSLEELRKMVLIYGSAIAFIEKIYHQFIENHSVDFEISIDETETPTTPLHHYFVARELHKRNIRLASIAPRFCGEFQKGVDYAGDLAEFTEEMKVHAAIARQMDYKISIHSGSDKFSVFSIIGRLTEGRFHLKTAGTSWLVAMELIALKAPLLFREIHSFALEAFETAKTYYHVSADLSRIPSIEDIPDERLAEIFRQNDERQLIHITYGLILSAKDSKGEPRFKERLFALWSDYAETYAQMLDQHIGRHLELLQVNERTGVET